MTETRRGKTPGQSPMAGYDLIFVAWYRREDYEQIRRLNPSGMRKSFDAWHHNAKRRLAEAVSTGAEVKSVFVGAEDFEAWLLSEGVESTSETRARYITDLMSVRRDTTH